MSPSFRSPFRKKSEGGEVDDSDAPSAPASSLGGEWIAYELHAWAQETRSMASQLLVADGLVHSWQGTTLMVHESAEEAVDALLEEVQVAGRRSLDPDSPQTAFEMNEWGHELREILIDRLAGIGVPHEFDDDGDLVIHEIDEEQVEMIIDEVLIRSEEHDLETLDGLEANDLLSEMFLATDRLRKNAGDSTGSLRVIKHGQRLVKSASPFGFDPSDWAKLREATGVLIDLIQQDDPPSDEISERAALLRETLRMLV